MSAQIIDINASKSFRKAAKPKKPKTYPFSVRLTAGEKAYIEQKAGNRFVGAYMRAKSLEGYAEGRIVLRKPIGNEPEIAALLAGLGQSRLSSNLNQLAKGMNTGTLDVSADVERQLQDACAAVLAMREALFTALGLKSGSGQ